MKLSQWLDEKYVNDVLIGVPSNNWEEKVIKTYDPTFYKTRVSKRKKKTDKNGLPIEPYTWQLRSAE